MFTSLFTLQMWCPKYPRLSVTWVSIICNKLNFKSTGPHFSNIPGSTKSGHGPPDHLEADCPGPDPLEHGDGLIVAEAGEGLPVH